MYWFREAREQIQWPNELEIYNNFKDWEWFWCFEGGCIKWPLDWNKKINVEVCYIIMLGFLKVGCRFNLNQRRSRWTSGAILLRRILLIPHLASYAETT